MHCNKLPMSARDVWKKQNKTKQKQTNKQTKHALI